MTEVAHFLHDVLAIANVPTHSCCFALVGPSGTGKSYCVNQLCHRLTASGYMRSSIAKCLGDEGTHGDATPIVEKRVIVTEYFSLVTDMEEYPPFGYDALMFAKDTVMIMDELELLDSLCQINGKTHLLQRLVRLFLNSKGCTLVVVVEDENNLPFYFTESHSSIVFKLASFSGEDVNRLRKRLTVETGRHQHTDAAAHSSCANLKLSKKSVVAALSLYIEAARPQDEDATANSHELFLHALASFVDGKGDFAATSQRIHLYGLQPLAERLRILVEVFVNIRQQKDAQRLVSKSVSTTGILLHGPSGCGKTALVQQLALDFPKVHFSFVNCTTLFSKYLGESEERLRAVYQAARAKAPAVVVLDEVDVIAPSRGSLNEATGGKTGVDVSSRMLAGLLCELDGVTDNSGVLTICTTNTPHVIDVALLRQGRLETVLCVPPLSVETAQEMTLDFFAQYGDDKKASTKEMLAQHLSEKMQQCTPASLKYMLRKILENQLRATRNTNAHVEHLDLPTVMEIDALIQQHEEIISPVHYTACF